MVNEKVYLKDGTLFSNGFERVVHGGRGDYAEFTREQIVLKLFQKFTFEEFTNQKDAYIHSVVNELLAYYDTVFMEDLNVQGMLKNHKLAKAIQEVGFYRFKQILEYKAKNNYKEVVFVGRFYPSSKTCHKCGYINKELTLNDREWTCPVCGEHHDRDLNAAINILLEGERIIGSRTTEFTLVDYPTMDERGLTT